MNDQLTSAFSPEQTGYLQGFVDAAKQLPFLGQNASGQFTADPAEAVEQTLYGTPIDELCREEVIKHEQNGLDCYDSILDAAACNEFASDGDIFRFKFHGLFYVTPAQDSYMLRIRVAGCAMDSRQFRGMAEIANDWGGKHGDITTRGNLQVREIMPEDTVKILTKLTEIGLTSRGSGADNVRNVTATPTTGFDPDELMDVLPLAKAMHYNILNNRDLYGLPRKFNISFDSGGAISVCADTNDIAFYAVKITEPCVTASGKELAPGVYFRMQLCGITGHKQFATDSGIILTAEETIPIAAAILRVFLENGDRTNRKKARLKYVVDDWGIPKLLEETQKKLAFPIEYLSEEFTEKPRPKVKHGHVGTFKQKDGQNYIGVVIPVGRMPVETMHDIADISDKYGTGDIRLTAWQNLLIPNIPDEKLEAAQAAIIAAGLQHTNTAISGGLVACTGNTGCKYAAANTKGHSLVLTEYLDSKLKLDQPVNIHLTGCNHSCAQHYVGDIGMMGVPVTLESGEKVEGYNIVFGGGVDDEQGIAKEVFKAIAFNDIPPLIENALRKYLELREENESFVNFTRRHEVDQLIEIFSPAA
ncbi:MAG: NirA family protein [Luteolibacter sp.]